MKNDRLFELMSEDFADYAKQLAELEGRNSLNDRDIESWAKAKAAVWLEQKFRSQGFIKDKDLESAIAMAIFYNSRDMYELEVKGKDSKRKPIGRRVLGLFLSLLPPHRHHKTQP